MVALSEFLKEEMRARHLSQSELARRIGVYPDYIRRWMDGDIPQPKKCEQIAVGLGMPISTVMQMAGYPVDEGQDADPQWEATQRELKLIFDMFERDRWANLTNVVRAVAPLVGPSLKDVDAPSFKNQPDAVVSEESSAEDAPQAANFSQVKDRTLALV